MNILNNINLSLALDIPISKLRGIIPARHALLRLASIGSERQRLSLRGVIK